MAYGLAGSGVAETQAEGCLMTILDQITCALHGGVRRIGVVQHMQSAGNFVANLG
ncbi:hypothetical protein [Alicycliphilus denitrificans]|uniref:hypothetical protein n=1 Tax=Alicycliphilus denitrificans TaxID=179636 RepID=UPI003850916A